MLAAFLFRRLDPQAPRKRYSWEVEEDAARAVNTREALEPPSPQDVPVLWQRETEDGKTGKVLPFPERPRTPPE